jgi:hypothetical protein
MDLAPTVTGSNPAGPSASSSGVARPRARALVAEYAPLGVLAIVAVIISLVVHHTVFPAYSWNRDEVVYLWQVQGLAEGKVLTSGGGTPLFFQPWLSGISDGMFFSQYTLGWPLVLLAGHLFGSTAASLAFGTALAVVGTYAFAREITHDRWIAIVAASVLVLSPMLVVQSGMYLSYLFSLGLGGLFGASLLAGLRRRRWWLLVFAGACVGWLFMTRPFDGFLWGGALVVYVVIAYWREKPRLVRGLAWAALGFLPLLVATLAYNRHITGSFTQFPITAADPRDSFGFGLRSIGTRWTPTNFTPWIAFKGVGRNGWELPPFLFGSYLGVVLAGYGLWLRRHARSTIALLAIFVVFPVGYFFFWGIALSASFARISGPIYFIPLFLPVSVLIGVALVSLWRSRRAVTIVVAAVLVLATVPFMADRLDINHGLSEAQVPWRDAESEIHGRSLVIVERSGPYLLHLNPYSDNPPDLDGRILYAADREAENLELLARHPDRRAYFEATDLTTEQTLADFDLPVPVITVTPITVEHGPVLTVRATVTNTSDDPVVGATLRLGGQVFSRVLSTTAQRGDSFVTEWRVAVPGAPSTTAETIALPGALGTFVIEAGSAPDGQTLVATPLERLQLSYRVDGTEFDVEVLTPGRASQFRARNGILRWRRATTLDGLDVQVSPAR